MSKLDFNTGKNVWQVFLFVGSYWANKLVINQLCFFDMATTYGDTVFNEGFIEGCVATSGAGSKD